MRKAAIPAIEAAARERRLFASVASVWEIALKAQRGELLIAGDLGAWVQQQRQYPGVRLVPVNARVAIASTTLSPWIRRRDGKEQRDPVDRFIVAAARIAGAVLITCDSEILEYARRGHVQAYDAQV